jgi:hypothetical protein
MQSRPKSKHPASLPVVLKDRKQVATRPVMLLVLGPHRSGTSLTARMLECLGAENSQNLNPPNFANPKGYFEDFEIYQFNDNILLPRLQQSWADVSSTDYSRLSNAERSRLGLQALEIIRSNYSLANPLSILKEPRINNTLPFWLSLLEHTGFDVRFVCTVRDPVSAARSMSQRNGFTLAHGSMIYLSAWLAVLPRLQERQVAFVQFDEIFTSPAKVLTTIAQKLSLPLPTDFDQRVHQFSSEHLDPSLRHSSLPREDVMLEPDLPPLVAELYRVLLDAAQSQNIRKTAKFVAYAERQIESLEPLLADYDAKQSRLASIQTKSEAATTECTRLKSQLDVSAQQNHAALVTERDELAARLASLESAHSSLSTLHSLLIAERDDLVTRHSALVTERETLQGQHSSLVAERDSLVQGRDQIRSERDTLAQERDQIVAERSDLVTRHSSLVTALENLQGQHSSLSTLHSSLIAERDALARERDQLRTRLIKLEGEYHALIKSERSLKISHNKLEEQFARANEALALLRNAQGETKSLRSSLASLQTEKDRVAKDRDRLATRMKEATDRIQTLEETIQERFSELAELAKQLISAEDSEQQTISERDNLAARLSALEEEHSELVTRYSSLAKEREALDADRTSLVVEHKDLQHTLNARFQELANIAKRLVHTQDELSRSQLMTQDFGPGGFAIRRCTLENVNASEPHLSLDLLLEGVESSDKHLDSVRFRIVQHHTKLGFAVLTSDDEKPPLTSWVRSTQEGLQSVMLVIPHDRSGLKQLRRLSQPDLCFVITALASAERTLRCCISKDSLTKEWHSAALAPWLERVVKLRAIVQGKAKLRV